MTKQLRNKTLCPACKHEFDSTTPFSQWIRDLPPPLHSGNYDCQNLDYVWNSYKGDGWLITIEEKRYGARSAEKSQRDTHNILRQMLFIASNAVVNTLRGKRPYSYRGHYEISFEKTTPLDSAWVRINGVEYDTPNETVKRLLATGKIDNIESVVAEDYADTRGYAWLRSFELMRLYGVVEWIGKRMKELAEKEKAA